ncbi:MAG: hypothetical protein V2I54_04825 [Bacteroidales bacterium]|jgi:hypothetical protein|nr:hypothetical protein [Bacteroidales bacterium]
MKKTNFLKVLMTLVLAFIITGAFAQGTDLPGDGAQFATNWDDNGDEPSTYVLEGQTIPLFAMPDPYYHPDYDPSAATPDYSLTAGFTWNWSVTAGNAADLTFGATNGTNDNYVEVTANDGSAGNTYTVNVLERAPAALGGCDDGAGQDVNIVVVDTATVTLGGDATYAGCEGSTGAPATITATIANGVADYRLAWNLEIATLDDASAKEFYYSDETGAGQSGTQFYAVDYTEAAPNTVAASTDITTVGSYAVINNGTRDAVTVYTYNLISINDKASRNGDFITLGGDASVPGNFTYFDYAETITITVYPAPETGPIYHIDNAWAN